jgi:glycosyltransferase involved in cell wall biosynthesis
MRAVIAVISDLSTDMRVQKHASLLAGMGCSVSLIGRYTGHSPALSLPGIRTIKIRVPFRKGPVMYLLFNLALLLRFLFDRADLYVANDLDTLIPCYISSRLFRMPLVYDAHEYFTGQYGLHERRLKYSLWKSAERWILPHVRHMITVSGSIADLYRHEYGVDPLVVMNLAPSTHHITPHKRSELGAPEDVLLVVYEGSGINRGRGATELVNAMTLLENVRLVIIGSGDIIEEIKDSVSEKKLENKIIFLPRMPWEDMIRFVMCCDAGLSLDTDTCTNQRYSLPNKLFDYIAAGIPAIVSPLPEVSAIIARYGCGMVLPDITPAAISDILVRLRDDRRHLSLLRKKAERAHDELSWENEKVKEQIFFRNIIEAKQEK